MSKGMNFRLTCYFVLTLVLVPLVSFGSDAKISINFKEVQLKNFIEYIGKVTNKNFVLDPNVGTKKNIYHMPQTNVFGGSIQGL